MFEFLLDHLPEPQLAALLGLLTGAVFGFSAQRSAFCLRAATVEFARGTLGPKVAVWLLTFSTALIWVQGAQLLGLFRAEEARMMAVAGSWSGAVIGGMMFGSGMVLARGCSGRLLVLAATGNLRSVISGLIFAVVAQMALHGWLAPARQWLAGLWVTPGGGMSICWRRWLYRREPGWRLVWPAPPWRCGWHGRTASARRGWSLPRAWALPWRLAGC